jgi:hypothetical protein
VACPALSVAPVASSEAFRPVWQAGWKVLDPLPILASLGPPARGSEPVREWAWAQLEEHLVVDFAAAAKEPQSACSSARTATSCSEEANVFDDSTYPTPARFHVKTSALTAVLRDRRKRCADANALKRREVRGRKRMEGERRSSQISPPRPGAIARKQPAAGWTAVRPEQQCRPGA